MAPHSSTLAWKIPWTEKPGRLQSMGSQRVWVSDFTHTQSHDWVTSLSLFTFMHWRRKWQPTSVFLPGESQGRGSLVGCHLWGCTESDTKQLSSSSRASLVAQTVKNLPAMQETWVWSLGWEDSLDMNSGSQARTSSILKIKYLKWIFEKSFSKIQNSFLKFKLNCSHFLHPTPHFLFLKHSRCFLIL